MLFTIIYLAVYFGSKKANKAYHKKERGVVVTNHQIDELETDKITMVATGRNSGAPNKIALTNLDDCAYCGVPLAAKGGGFATLASCGHRIHKSCDYLRDRGCRFCPSS
jgi:hypothetical protein